MVTEEPKVALDGLYNVTQTCKALGIHKNTLRKYTDAGLIPVSLRRGTMTKVYKGRHIRRFWQALA